MSIDVTIVDYGRGNLLSVARALEHLGARVVLADSPDGLKTAGHLILPGVGAFGGAMQQLNSQGLSDHLKVHVAKGRPLLGICLGMQLLLDRGEEFGNHDGLGLIHGDVIEMPALQPNGLPQKKPHIGWSPTMPASGHDWDHTIFEGVAPKTNHYYVHSFISNPTNISHCLAVTDYNGHELTAAIQHENIIGVQFHPEKSGPAGLSVLSNFLRL
jgi:imidazole glycerol-phosphate synthase subunit HisH